VSVGPGLVLALDLSTIVGWGAGRPGDNLPAWGALVLPKEHGRGAVCSAYEDWLDGRIADLAPDVVVYEAPLNPHQQRDRESCFYAFGLAMATEACAWRAGVECRSYALDTVRSAVLGRKTLTAADKARRPRPTVKTAIVAPFIASMGWVVPQPDAADALIVWLYAIGHRHAGFRKRAA
jgi:hypothetical protein